MQKNTQSNQKFLLYSNKNYDILILAYCIFSDESSKIPIESNTVGRCIIPAWNTNAYPSVPLNGLSDILLPSANASSVIRLVFPCNADLNVWCTYPSWLHTFTTSILLYSNFNELFKWILVESDDFELGAWESVQDAEIDIVIPDGYTATDTVNVAATNSAYVFVRVCWINSHNKVAYSATNLSNALTGVKIKLRVLCVKSIAIWYSKKLFVNG